MQPEGVSDGTRVVPLRYPMSVHWSGSSDLAIGSGADAVKEAKADGKVAILDPETRVLTALKPGSVIVSVTNDSMREYTDQASLAPVTTSKTITVEPASTGADLDAGTPVFTAQPVGTSGQTQQVTVTNTGDQPLKIHSVSIKGGSGSPFGIDQNSCTSRTVAVNGNCVITVRCTPPTPNTTSQASLVLGTNTKQGTESVALTGTSTRLQWSTGTDGPAGIPGQERESLAALTTAGVRGSHGLAG